MLKCPFLKRKFRLKSLKTDRISNVLAEKSAFSFEKKHLTNRECDKKERKLLNNLFVWRAEIFTNEPVF